MQSPLTRNLIVYAENLSYMRTLPDGAFRLIYIDPPFNTGKVQQRARMRVVASEQGVRVGFGDRRYQVQLYDSPAYQDAYEDYLGFLEPRLREAYRLLTPDGSLFVHLDYREAHYVKVLLDTIFGRECFMNEIIWAYDYGGRSKRRWPAKHDTIFWYAKDPERYVFNYEAIDRIPYMAPESGGCRKGAAGQDADRCVVADDCAHQQQGEDGLPDAEAAEVAGAHRARA
jgi:site-specific DNA-methyltransferase (adenine-specific)